MVTATLDCICVVSLVITLEIGVNSHYTKLVVNLLVLKCYANLLVKCALNTMHHFDKCLFVSSLDSTRGEL